MKEPCEIRERGFILRAWAIVADRNIVFQIGNGRLLPIVVTVTLFNVCRTQTMYYCKKLDMMVNISVVSPSTSLLLLEPAQERQHSNL